MCAALFLPESIALDAAVGLIEPFFLHLMFRTSSVITRDSASAQGRRKSQCATTVCTENWFQLDRPQLNPGLSILALETTSDHPLRMSSGTGSALLSFKQSLTLHFRSHCTSYVGQVLELLLLWSIVHDHGAVG